MRKFRPFSTTEEPESHCKKFLIERPHDIHEMHLFFVPCNTYPYVNPLGTSHSDDGSQGELDSLGLKANTTIYSLRAQLVT